MIFLTKILNFFSINLRIIEEIIETPMQNETVAEEMINPNQAEQVFTPAPSAYNFPTMSAEDISENNLSYSLPSQLNINSRFSSSPQIAKEHLENDRGSPSSCYTMEKNPLGQFVIINNWDFTMARNKGKGLKDRPDTTRDVTRLRETFNSLFEIFEYENFTAKEIENGLSYFGNQDHSNYDCFACCILTHGNQNSLYGVDGEELDIQHALSFFKMTPTLRGKPKLFFFQACRGVKGESIHQYDSGFDSVSGLSHVLSGYTIPSGADFFLGYATPPG